MEYEPKIKVLVIDAQGGGLGRQLVSAIRRELPNVRVMAVGTNTAATTAMLRAGAHEAATGENSVIVAARSADIIVGPLGIVIADSMLGEVTPKMAVAIAQARAQRVLIPFLACDTRVVGASDMSMGHMIVEAVTIVRNLCDEL